MKSPEFYSGFFYACTIKIVGLLSKSISISRHSCTMVVLIFSVGKVIIACYTQSGIFIKCPGKFG